LSLNKDKFIKAFVDNLEAGGIESGSKEWASMAARFIYAIDQPPKKRVNYMWFLKKIIGRLIYPRKTIRVPKEWYGGGGRAKLNELRKEPSGIFPVKLDNLGIACSDNK
jgi:hypothetical protein